MLISFEKIVAASFFLHAGFRTGTSVISAAEKLLSGFVVPCMTMETGQKKRRATVSFTRHR
jgi:hypothetical protein